jgi:hypothetical protein
MSVGVIPFMRANAENPNEPQPVDVDVELDVNEEESSESSLDEGEDEAAPVEEWVVAPVSQLDLGRDPDLWLYRERTVALLKRYGRLAVEVGRLPSLLGREFFRTRVTPYHVFTFEDAVIFVHDVESSLAKLDVFAQALIATIVFQEYTQDEAADVLRCWRRTVGRRFPEVLDELSEIFLNGGLLRRLPCPAKQCEEVRVPVDTAEVVEGSCEVRDDEEFIAPKPDAPCGA